MTTQAAINAIRNIAQRAQAKALLSEHGDALVQALKKIAAPQSSRLLRTKLNSVAYFQPDKLIQMVAAVRRQSSGVAK